MPGLPDGMILPAPGGLFPPGAPSARIQSRPGERGLGTSVPASDGKFLAAKNGEKSRSV